MLRNIVSLVHWIFLLLYSIQNYSILYYSAKFGKLMLFRTTAIGIVVIVEFKQKGLYGEERSLDDIQ